MAEIPLYPISCLRISGTAAISSWLTSIFAPLFVCGVASGLLMPFLFGTGWSRFSVFSGELFGSILAIESSVAFTLESVFLGILVFGKKRVSPRVYLIASCCVLLGTLLSAFFIVAANSWMQTPAGYAVQDGRVVVTSMMQALFNPSTITRFLHVLTAAWIAGSVITCALASYCLLNRRNEPTARAMLTVGIIWLFATPLAQLLLGHEHIMQVVHHQPEKSAAYEGVFKTTKDAPLYIFGIPDAEHESVKFGIKIPWLFFPDCRQRFSFCLPLLPLFVRYFWEESGHCLHAQKCRDSRVGAQNVWNDIFFVVPPGQTPGYRSIFFNAHRRNIT